MINDPIVEEVRQAREKILAEVGGDLRKLADRLRQMQLRHPERIVTLEEVRRRRGEANQSSIGQ